MADSLGAPSFGTGTVEERPAEIETAMGYSSAKTVVGLDIQPGYVIAAETRGGKLAVDRAATVSLAPGVVRDGEVADVGSLAASLRTLFSENKLGKRVRVGVANQRIVMRTVDLPPLTNAKEISSAVRFQAQEHIPMPLEQAVLEHHSLGVIETAEGPRTRVVLVAARRDMIDRVLQAVKGAGLRPHGIDLSAFAMIRALHQPERTGPTLYMNVGGITNLAIAVGTTCLFTRVIAHGTESIAAALSERRGLTLEHSHAWLRHVGLQAPVEKIQGDPDIVLETRNVLMESSRRIADDVRNSIDFHAMQVGAAGLEGAVLTGPAISIPGLGDELAQAIGLPLDVGLIEEARAGGFGGVEPGHLAVAAGLTFEEASA
jgi:type IV pilus assembly protein PilM